MVRIIAKKTAVLQKKVKKVEKASSVKNKKIIVKKSTSSSDSKKVKAFKKPGLIIKKPSTMFAKILPASLGAFALGALAGTVIKRAPKDDNVIREIVPGQSCIKQADIEYLKNEASSIGREDSKKLYIKQIDALSEANSKNTALIKENQDTIKELKFDNERLTRDKAALVSGNLAWQDENIRLKAQLSVMQSAMRDQNKLF